MGRLSSACYKHFQGFWAFPRLVLRSNYLWNICFPYLLPVLWLNDALLFTSINCWAFKQAAALAARRSSWIVQLPIFWPISSALLPQSVWLVHSQHPHRLASVASGSGSQTWTDRLRAPCCPDNYIYRTRLRIKATRASAFSVGAACCAGLWRNCRRYL